MIGFEFIANEGEGEEIEFTIQVEYQRVTRGGSNSYRSDEPAWAEVEGLELFDENGKPLTQETLDRLTPAQMDAIYDRCIEIESDW